MKLDHSKPLTVIVLNVVVSDHIVSIEIEIVNSSRLDIVVLNPHIFVTVRSRLHVIKAQCVQKLVDDCEEAEAADFDVVRG